MICEKKFSHKKNVTRHIGVTHGFNSLLRCRHCLKTYTRKDHLQRHLAKSACYINIVSCLSENREDDKGGDCPDGPSHEEASLKLDQVEVFGESQNLPATDVGTSKDCVSTTCSPQAHQDPTLSKRTV